MSNLINTHYYDGKWNVDFVNYKISHEDFIECISEINNKFNCESIRKVSNLVLTDLKNNWDPSNNISFEYICIYVWNKVKSNEDLLPLFKEQYQDILNGTCSQGRTTRLYQIYLIVKDM